MATDETPPAETPGTGERWARVQEILAELEQLDASGADDATLANALERATDGDAALRAQVQRLRLFEQSLGSFLEEPAVLDRGLVDAKLLSFGGTDGEAAGDSAPHTRWSEALEPGALVGPYEVAGLLGHGGMGEVYHAVRREPFEQHVALKVVKGGLRTADVLRRFGDERQILARLEHPLIARLIDGGSTDEGRPYLAMEKVDGEPIDTWCDRHRLGIDARLRIFLRVLEAVTYAHRSAVVHRDLKPSNLLVDAKGTPRLLDFGIAKLIDRGTEGSDPTQLGSRALTLPYASPEQIEGKPTGVASDVYSLGVVLYRLLTGAFPHEATTDLEVMRRIVHQDPPTASRAVARATDLDAIARSRGLEPRALRRALRGDLDAILDRALARNPDERYLSVDRLADDLEAYLEKRPVVARHGALAYRARRWALRNAAALAVALVGFATLAGWAGTAWVQERERFEAERAQLVADQERLAEWNRRAETQQLLLDLFGETKPSEMGATSNAKYEAIGDLLDDFEREVRSRGDERFLASALGTLASVRSARGEVDFALALILESLQLRERLEGRDDNPRIANGDSLLASILMKKNRTEEAIDLFERSRTVLASFGDLYGEELARVVNNLGRAHKRAKNWAEAERFLREALALKQTYAPEDQRTISTTRSNLAGVLRRVGRRDEAIVIYEEILEWAEQPGEAGDLERAGSSWNGLGTIYMDLERYDEALDAFDRALEIRRKYLKNEEDEELATAAANRGVALTRLGRADEAEAPLRAVIALLENQRPGWRLVRYRNHLAATLMALGRSDDARAEVQTALETARALKEDSETIEELEARLRELEPK